MFRRATLLLHLSPPPVYLSSSVGVFVGVFVGGFGGEGAELPVCIGTTKCPLDGAEKKKPFAQPPATTIDVKKGESINATKRRKEKKPLAQGGLFPMKDQERNDKNMV